MQKNYLISLIAIQIFRRGNKIRSGGELPQSEKSTYKNPTVKVITSENLSAFF